MVKSRTYRVPFTWRDVSTYRGELFGVAILSIVLYHYFMVFNNTEAPNAVLRVISKFYNSAVSSVGVDIFIFLSGFGLYYSLSRGGKLTTYYRKSVYRVVVPYLVCGLIYWGIIDFVFLHVSIRQFLLDYSLLSFWISGTETLWYISFITILYIISPFIYRMTNDTLMLVIGVLCSFGLIILCYFAAPDFFHNIERALQRLPYFLIGMGAGKQSKNMTSDDEQGIPLWLACVIVCAVFVKVLVGKTNFVLGRSFYGYYGIFLIFAYVMVRKAMAGRWNGLFSVFSILGRYSLEIYIVHTAVKNIMTRLGFSMQNPLIYLLHIAIVIPLVACVTKLLNILEAPTRGRGNTVKDNN